MEKIRKVFTGEIKEVNDQDMTLLSIVSTNAVDRMGDVIEQDGIDLKRYRKNPVVLWAHDYATPPIGKSLWIKIVDGKLVSKMKFADTPRAQEIFSLYKGGFLSAFSIGFIPKESEPMKEGDNSMFGPRRFKKTEMLEYSAVPVPANAEALAMAMSKGLALSDPMKKDLEDSHIDDIETVEKIEEPVKGEGLTELISENKNLNEAIQRLEKENADLKWRVFCLIEEKQKQLSEIADHTLLRKAEEIMVGAIRKAQGKID